MIKNFILTILSALRVVMRYYTCSNLKDSGSGRTLRILGNGKSLLGNTFHVDSNVDYMVVNRHVLSDSYTDIKPLFYVIADPFFFSKEAGLDILRKIDERTTWKLFLCVPYSRKYRKLLSNYISNPNISLQYYNACYFKGVNKLSCFLYKHQIAMPVVMNVLVASVMLGIYMKYPVIELYGVEHSWTKFLSVGEDNLVYLENPHFFDKDKKVEARPMKDIQLVDKYPLYMLLENYAQMFKSYCEIKRYLIHSKLPIDIINKTKGSFIDAFRRE